MELLPDTTALGAIVAASAAMVLLGLNKQLLVRRRFVCPACRLDSRDCRCRRPAH